MYILYIYYSNGQNVRYKIKDYAKALELEKIALLKDSETIAKIIIKKSA